MSADPGILLRDRGIEQLELALGPDPWSVEADQTITDYAATGREFTAESIRLVCGDPGRPQLMGVAFLRAVKRGLIEQVGWRRAQRPERHGGVLAVWRGRRP